MCVKRLEVSSHIESLTVLGIRFSTKLKLSYDDN